MKFVKNMLYIFLIVDGWIDWDWMDGLEWGLWLELDWMDGWMDGQTR